MKYSSLKCQELVWNYNISEGKKTNDFLHYHHRGSWFILTILRWQRKWGMYLLGHVCLKKTNTVFGTNSWNQQQRQATSTSESGWQSTFGTTSEFHWQISLTSWVTQNPQQLTSNVTRWLHSNSTDCGNKQTECRSFVRHLDKSKLKVMLKSLFKISQSGISTEILWWCTSSPSPALMCTNVWLINYLHQWSKGSLKSNPGVSRHFM